MYHLEYRSLINHIKINKLPAVSPFGSLTTNLLMYAIYHQMEVPTTHLCVCDASKSEFQMKSHHHLAIPVPK